MFTCCDGAGWRETIGHPTKRLGGSPVEAGKARYTCATSAPATAPVLVRLKQTWKFGLPAEAMLFTTVAFENENVVYDSPKPKGNSGVRPCESYHLYPTLKHAE